MGHLKLVKKNKSQSSHIFDNLLKIQNKYWDIRDIEEVTDEAKKKWFFSRRYY